MEEIVYLDSSAIVKRYVMEPGSNIVRSIYLKAYTGENILSYSIWNIGEVLGVFDRAKITSRVDENTYRVMRKRFLLETRRLMKLGVLLLIPLKTSILRNAWSLIEKHHIYEADAVQVASAKYIGASRFLTGDKRLHDVAVDEGLNSIYLGELDK